MAASITSDITGNPLTSAEYEFIVSLEIREKVAKVMAIIFRTQSVLHLFFVEFLFIRSTRPLLLPFTRKR